MADILIDHLSVEFGIYGSNTRSMKSRIVNQATGGRVRADARDIITVVAIDDLQLHVRDGDRIGLVGHNGSGKTTLLRVLAGIYRPAKGSITVTGKVGALLDPSAGMDPDSTGMENIFLRGYMLGMGSREIRTKIDSIVDFAELGDFIDLPMRTYSAGMFARLAFAISTATHNDILLIDEGIGAGDAKFREKAHRRIESLFDRTPIVLLASHTQELISTFCNRQITMEHGKVIGDGPIQPVTR